MLAVTLFLHYTRYVFSISIIFLPITWREIYWGSTVVDLQESGLKGMLCWSWADIGKGISC